ncbi:MAG: hypothetical protein ACI86P_001686, partial [Flavobacteriales bacterium]
GTIFGFIQMSERCSEKRSFGKVDVLRLQLDNMLLKK